MQRKGRTEKTVRATARTKVTGKLKGNNQRIWGNKAANAVKIRDILNQIGTDEYSTPNPVFDVLNEEFKLDLDVCSTHENAKCPRHFTKMEDGLKKKWTGRIWMNPSYGAKNLALWMKKAYESVTYGDAQIAVCLVPAATDVGWWHDWAWKENCELIFVRGRIKFAAALGSPRFGSVVVVINPPNTPAHDCRNIAQRIGMAKNEKGITDLERRAK